MAQPIQVNAISAPGFMGLNTQDSSLDMAQGFALVANNCIIDQYGRIGARKGWLPQHATLAALSTAPIKAIGQLVIDDGSEFIISAGNNKLFIMVNGALSELTYGGAGVAPTIIDSNWQLVTLNQVMYFFQEGHTPLAFQPTTSTTTYRRISEMVGYSGTVPSANVAVSAYGRLWVASSTTEKKTISFSDILAGQAWTAGSSGTLNVSTVWPSNSDTITGIAAHNGSLFIFGKNTILIYTGAKDPTTMVLSDTVTGIGCIARDSIQNTGSDIIFLSDTGVRSIARTIQEKSAPFRDFSKNVRNDLMSAVNGETASTIKSVYNPFESFYLLTMPVLKTVYCFDMKVALQDGSARMTTWDSIEPTAFCYLRNRDLLIGKAGFIGKYTGYTDNTTSYRLQYFTTHVDLGLPSVTSLLKKITATVIGGSNQYVSIKWGYDFSGNYQAQTLLIPSKGVAYYGVSEYNISEYTAGTSLQALVAYPSGAGKIVQTGYESQINGSSLSIQRIEIQSKNGRLS